MNPIVTSILWQSLVGFLFIVSAAGLVLGLLLIFRPTWLQSASKFTNRWVSTRRLDQVLERSLSIDIFFYRYRLVAGVLLLVCAVFILYFFTVQFDRTSAMAMGMRYFHWPLTPIEVLVDTFILSNYVGALSAVIVSLFMLLQPELLLDFEDDANHWVSSRRALKSLEMVRNGVDEAIFQHRQVAGALLILGSLYIVMVLMIWLIR